MKTQKTEKAARCSSLRRRFAGNAKVGAKKLKRGLTGVYVMVLTGLLTTLIGQVSISSAHSLSKYKDLIFSSEVLQARLAILLFLLLFHDKFLTKERCKKINLAGWSTILLTSPVVMYYYFTL